MLYLPYHIKMRRVIWGQGHSRGHLTHSCSLSTSPFGILRNLYLVAILVLGKVIKQQTFAFFYVNYDAYVKFLFLII